MRKLLITLMLLFGVGAVYAAADPRVVADAIVAEVIANNNAAIHERLAPLADESLTLDHLTKISASLRAAFGNPKEVTYWQIQKGFQQSGPLRTPITVVWYRMTTDKYSENVALTVTLVEQNGTFVMQGYNFMRNMGKPSGGTSGPA
jgi:hypothetical protein